MLFIISFAQTRHFSTNQAMIVTQALHHRLEGIIYHDSKIQLATIYNSHKISFFSSIQSFDFHSVNLQFSLNDSRLVLWDKNKIMILHVNPEQFSVQAGKIQIHTLKETIKQIIVTPLFSIISAGQSLYKLSDNRLQLIQNKVNASNSIYQIGGYTVKMSSQQLYIQTNQYPYLTDWFFVENSTLILQNKTLLKLHQQEKQFGILPLRFRQFSSNLLIYQTEQRLQIFKKSEDLVQSIFNFTLQNQGKLKVSSYRDQIIIIISRNQTYTEQFLYKSQNFHQNMTVKSCQLCYFCKNSCQKLFRTQIDYYKLLNIRLLMIICLFFARKRFVMVIVWLISSACKKLLAFLRKIKIFILKHLRFIKIRILYQYNKNRNKTQLKDECCLCCCQVEEVLYFPCGRHPVHLQCLSQYQKYMTQNGLEIKCPLRD